ncbi:MAG TPA: putative lipid II flippase FtsW [Vicinamibacterales bacterium]|nr:putative lipid II flippase FtsW [Vicinamibacterales bacterium]
MARTLRSDKILFWAALILVCTSVVMVVSASAATDPMTSVLFRQIGFAAVGLIAMFAVMRTNYHHLRNPVLIGTALVVAFVGLALVFAFHERNGAQRWIRLFGLSLQPSEFAKITAVIFAATILERRMHRIDDVKYSLLPVAIVTGVMAFLIVEEPDLGTSIVVVMAVMSMAFVAGLSWRYLAGFVLLMLPAVTYYILTHPYRVNRIMAFLWPDEQTQLKEGWQLLQSKIALGSGGLLGLGLGGSMQKRFFLPEANNDFILAVIGEETGLIGTTALLVCFAVVAWRGLRAALLAPDRFGTLLGIGLSMMIAMQAFLNVTVVTGMAPTKGIPLPLVSAGGTSLLISLVAIGILLNISQQRSSAAAASVDAG